VYCRKHVGQINPADLTVAIKDRLEDFSDLFAQEDPDDVLARLRIEEVPSESYSQTLHLHYLEDGPPIVISRVGNQEIVTGEVQEYLEDRFKDREGGEESLVREHLAKTVEIVHFCLKQRHADGMGMPLVYAAATWLAQFTIFAGAP
jgi:hypothetical protein